MKDIGLHPSNTGEPGGKEIGQKVSHYIIAGGAFERACAEFMRSGFRISYGDLWADDEAKAKTKAMKKASKTKFSRPACAASAWGKPALRIPCVKYNQLMITTEDDDEG